MNRPTSREDIWNVGAILEWVIGYFRERSLDSPRLDAEVLIAHVLECRRIDLYAMYDSEVDVPDRNRIRELVKRRADGNPIAYLVGSKEFYSLEFDVGPQVLIPRPETEFLVGEALAFANQEPIESFLDVGVGSGAIAVTLAHRLDRAEGLGCDISDAALETAQRNADRHGVADRLRFSNSDLFESLAGEGPFDLIVSNPPYVATEDFPALEPDVRESEPRLALDGGPGGFRILERLIHSAGPFLRPGGGLFLEIGAGQSERVEILLREADFDVRPTIRDLAGVPRVASGIRR